MPIDGKNKKIVKLLNLADEHISTDEKIYEAIVGSYETKSMGNDTVRTGIMIATNKKLFFYGKRTFGFDSESFPYSNISSIDHGKTMLGNHITFYSSNNKVSMKWINSGDIEGFISYVKNRITNKETSIPKSNSPINNEKSPVEQVKELKELLDLDIITEAEFNIKKNELLGL